MSNPPVIAPRASRNKSHVQRETLRSSTSLFISTWLGSRVLAETREPFLLTVVVISPKSHWPPLVSSTPIGQPPKPVERQTAKRSDWKCGQEATRRISSPLVPVCMERSYVSFDSVSFLHLLMQRCHQCTEIEVCMTGSVYMTGFVSR
jgi:hypothetical protein